MKINKRGIKASEDMPEANVAAEVTDMLFEAEDVAELVAEVTGKPVDVTADEDEVVFNVDGDEFTVTADGDEEILEAVRRPFRGTRGIKASTRRPAVRAAARRPVSATRRPVAAANRNTKMLRKSATRR